MQELLRLLDDPAVQTWLKQTRVTMPPSPSPEAIDAQAEEGGGFAASHIARIRMHVRGLRSPVTLVAVSTL